jgi:asparagine synthase (glutamine-hydrolysing)
MQRRKMGFGLPSNAWSKEAVLDLARDLLVSSSSRLGGLLDAKALTGLVDRQALPGWFSIYQLWPLLILELWLRKRPSAGTTG